MHPDPRIILSEDLTEKGLPGVDLSALTLNITREQLYNTEGGRGRK